MLEIKLYGRGGQGLVVASQILGLGYFKSGMYPQCYSVYGGERRGAPVMAFLRVDTERILLKCEIARPDELIYLDQSLINTDDIASLLDPGGRIVINTARPPEEFSHLADYELGLIDASAAAAEQGLGRMINTTVLGAYCGFGDRLEPEHLLAAMKDLVPAKMEANLKSAALAGERLIVVKPGGVR